ncbi:transposase, partial [Bacillus niameyensis]|uniref:transposase n=1 Tax=Bacillus niameyensis TaxID=1522308 RepID=UPI0012B58054
MAKYTDDFKVMVVREYLEGKIGYKRLAEKHGVKSKKQVINWVNAYKKFGMEGLFRKKKMH